jgi:RNA polymerase sigma factor (sigma-70 family)
LAEISDLISGCARNDPKYQRLLYDRYRGYACKIVFRYIYHYERAVDVVTDGFVKAFTHFSSFEMKSIPDEPEKLLMGWLKRIMINCSIDELRRTSMLPEIGGIPDEVWDISDKHDNADRLILYKDVISMIKKLPPRYRVVLNLHVIDGYSHNEISEMLHIPANTCRSNCSRAKSLLIELINKSEQINYAGLRT